MPIIEYIHLTKTYRISIARTVEWKATVCTVTHPTAPYAPFVGYGEDSYPDAEIVLETADDNEAFSKMTELWAKWQANGFKDVVHA
jgi:hypothetical protein